MNEIWLNIKLCTYNKELDIEMAFITFVKIQNSRYDSDQKQSQLCKTIHHYYYRKQSMDTQNLQTLMKAEKL